ncbi:MAG: substrate-binding domain-containing protein, partial [Anaerolineales bacterium]
MSKKMILAIASLSVAGLMLSACGSATQAATETIAPAGSATNTGPATAAAQTATNTTLAPGSVKINGAGATFPLPVYSAWTYAYKYVDPSVVINYQGIGSGGGKKAIIDGTVDFAGSDSLVTDAEYASGKDLQMYPMVAGAVVPVYNIKWAKDFPTGTTVPVLVLDRQTLVDIYNAKVTKWNDPEIVATNLGLKDYLPAS